MAPTWTVHAALLAQGGQSVNRPYNVRPLLTPRSRAPDTWGAVADSPKPLLPVRVRLRYPDVDSFCEKFAPNVTRGGVFLASRDPRPVGSVIRFEVCLMDGTPVLAGEGKVTWVKEFNPAEPGKPHGMGVQFLGIDPASKTVLDRVLRIREADGARRTGTQLGVPTVPIGGSGPAGATPVRGVPITEAVIGEFDRVEESALRRVVDRARILANRTDDIEALLRSEPADTATLASALAELPRYLGSGRRGTGLFRVAPEAPTAQADTKPPVDPDDV